MDQTQLKQQSSVPQSPSTHPIVKTLSAPTHESSKDRNTEHIFPNEPIQHDKEQPNPTLNFLIPSTEGRPL